MSKVSLIGVCGRKRHGKDSVGKILRDSHGFHLTAFADAVKRVAMDVYGLSWEQCYGDGPEKESVDLRWGLSPRVIMQKIGTEVGRSIHESTWVKHTLDNIQESAEGREYTLRDDQNHKFVRISTWADPKNKWVVTDVRFPNEAQAIRDAGGLVLKVVRPGLGVPTDEHPSETSVDLIVPDFLIENTGTLEDLARAVNTFTTPIRAGLFGRESWHVMQEAPFTLEDIKKRRWENS